MTRSSMNGNNPTEWKQVTYIRHNKGKKNTMNKKAGKKEPKGGKYKGSEGIFIKQEEMKAALVDKCPSPKRKRDHYGYHRTR